MTENLAGRGEGLAGLRELSEKAAQGEWELYEDTCRVCREKGITEWNIKGLDPGWHAMFAGKENAEFIVAAVKYVRAALEAAAPAGTPLNTQKLMNNDRLEEIRAQLYGTDDGITIDDAKWLLHAYEQLINRVATPSPQASPIMATAAGMFSVGDSVLVRGEICGLRDERDYKIEFETDQSINYAYAQLSDVLPMPAATQEQPAGSEASELKPGICYHEIGGATNASRNEVTVTPGSPRKVGEDGQSATKIWTCKIGEITQERFANLPNGLDFPMRIAIKEAYERITGKEPNFCFSGWGGALTEGERAVVENRPPNRPSSVPVGEQKQEEGV